ncbi:MAG: hypothetical protein R2862_09530 [Thermoanaerobaculia bacterium]
MASPHPQLACDRGSGEVDHRPVQPRAERVFGATGAATLFRRAALVDVALDGPKIFVDRFHSFREDAELAFRFAERGWQVVYAPGRGDPPPPGRCRAPRRAAINFHSLKNRYLLRIDHQSAANYVRTLPWTLGRDLRGGYDAAPRRSSLPVTTAGSGATGASSSPIAGRCAAGSPRRAARSSAGSDATEKSCERSHRKDFRTRTLRVALLGSRGIPARYGGYETLMHELAPRLVARGYDVTVYTRPHARRARPPRGPRRAADPPCRAKHLDTPFARRSPVSVPPANASTPR